MLFLHFNKTWLSERLLILSRYELFLLEQFLFYFNLFVLIYVFFYFNVYISNIFKFSTYDVAKHCSKLAIKKLRLYQCL